MNFWKGSADVVRNDGQSCKHFLHDVDDNQNYVGKYEDKSPFAITPANFKPGMRVQARPYIW